MSIVLFALFVAESSRGLVISTLFLYLQTVGGAHPLFVAGVVGGFSVGRLVGGILLGYWFNKRGAKNVLFWCFAVSALANLLYSMADPLHEKWIILGSRVVVGFGSGVLSVGRASIAEITTEKERTRFISYSTAVQFVGFSLMPGVAALLSFVDFSVGPFSVNKYTASGYLLFLMNVLVMALVWFLLDARPPQKETIQTPGKDVSASQRRLYLWGVWLFIFLNFAARGVIALLETVGTPEYLDALDEPVADPVKHSSTFFLILGCFGLVMFFSVDFLKRFMQEHNILVSAFVIIAGGSLLLIEYTHDVSLIRFYVGAALIWSVGSPLTQTIVISSFSKILGSKPQGTMMGWIGSAGSVGRILFPLLTGAFGEDISFVVSAVLCLVCGVGVIAYERYARYTRQKIAAARQPLFNDFL